MNWVERYREEEWNKYSKKLEKEMLWLMIISYSFVAFLSVYLLWKRG